MKDFLKSTLATVVGIVLTGIIFFIFGIITLGSIIASSNIETRVYDNSLFKLTLSGTLQERAQYNPIAELFSDAESIGLDDVLSSIKKAETNDNIKGIYIEAGDLAGAAPASMQAIHDALAKFKESGKFVVAYADNYSQGMYYTCSVADKLILNPQGMVDWHGLSAQIMFYKKVLEKVGVKMQVFKVGTYKSAVEPFICDEMSDANREQINSYIGSIWGEMLSQVSASRGISIDTLNLYADSYLAFTPAQELLKMDIVDTLLYKDGVKEYLKQLTGCDGSLRTLSLEDMKNVNISTPKDKSGNIIAVYYAYGEIVDAQAAYNFGAFINPSKVCKDLSKLRDDDNVKAVIFRVNSPGGSAYGSEQIWREVSLLKEKKPVIVSMGDYAASGGYYISCNADSIFAEPTTITGSIGIFGMFPDYSNLLTEKIGISYDAVSTNKLGDFGRPDRPINREEGALLQSYINRGYELFVSRCADGRGMSTDAIKAIAEGRVWTGEQALGLGLVDALGNMDDAIAAGAQKAGIENYTLIKYPEEENFLTQLMNNKKEDYISSELRSLLGEHYQAYNLLHNIDKKDRIQAVMPYTFTIK